MNSPPIFSICAADPGVTALLGTSPVRLFMFGMAPQNIQKPYAVWQVISGLPESYLAGRPDTDQHLLQIDVDADDASEARTVLGAIVHAVGPHRYVVGYMCASRVSEKLQ